MSFYETLELQYIKTLVFIIAVDLSVKEFKNIQLVCSFS